jgi:hypothetical protein
MVTLSRFSEEEKARLLELYEDYGPQWQKIGDMMGRSGLSCCDAYRNLSAASSKSDPVGFVFKKKGAWNMWAENSDLSSASSISFASWLAMPYPL